ncbi:unnamed protein product, partial [marine sediment metagenome]
RQSLLDDFKVPEEQIAIVTGDKSELEGVEVLASSCEVRFIITVAKLREGWDCPFAYVLCSVSNLTSHRAVEQIMGRVLRMPHAHRKQHTELNYAYVFATSQGFADAANALTDALVESGFNPYEARASIRPQPGQLFPSDMPLWQSVSEVVSMAPSAEAIPETIREHVHTTPAKSVIETGAGELVATLITYDGPPIPSDVEVAWQDEVSSEEEKQAVMRLARKSRGEDASPAATGKTFSIPRLVVRDGDRSELFEDQFRDSFWQLSQC